MIDSHCHLDHEPLLSDLANNYGNLCQRVTAFAIKNCNGKIPLEVKFHDEDLLILNLSLIHI